MTKKVLRRHTYKLDPTLKQTHLLNKWFGSYRYAWNLLVTENKSKNETPNLRKNLSNSEICTFLKDLRNSTSFLKEVHSHVFLIFIIIIFKVGITSLMTLNF